MLSSEATTWRLFVLHAMMDLAHQPPLPVERIKRLSLRILDSLDRPFKRPRQVADFGGGAIFGWKR
jgi:hypothetical protein